MESLLFSFFFLLADRFWKFNISHISALLEATCATRYIDLTHCRIGIIVRRQSWALEVFFNFFNNIKFNSILYFNSHRAIQFFTVFQVIYVINYFTENKFYVFIKLFMIAFSLICMSCGNIIKKDLFPFSIKLIT